MLWEKQTFRGLLNDIGMSVVKEWVHTSAKFPNTPRDKKKKRKNKKKHRKLCTIRYQSRSKWGKEGFSLRWAEVKLKLNFSYL